MRSRNKVYRRQLEPRFHVHASPVCSSNVLCSLVDCERCGPPGARQVHFWELQRRTLCLEVVGSKLPVIPRHPAWQGAGGMEAVSHIFLLRGGQRKCEYITLSQLSFSKCVSAQK